MSVENDTEFANFIEILVDFKFTSLCRNRKSD